MRVWRQLLGGNYERDVSSIGANTSFQSQAQWRANLRELRQHVRYDEPLINSEYVVIDTETTGFHPSEDQVLSIAAVVLDIGVHDLRTVFQTYVALRSGSVIPKTVQELTGITPEMLATAPEISDALMQFLRFIGDRIIVAHHAGFDIRFINIALRKAFGIELDHIVLDTGKIAMILHSFDQYPSLDALIAWYDISSSDRHSAQGDARMTAEIFWVELVQLSHLGIHTLGDLWERLMWLENSRVIRE